MKHLLTILGVIQLIAGAGISQAAECPEELLQARKMLANVMASSSAGPPSSALAGARQTDVAASRVTGTGDVQAPRVSGTGDVQAPRVTGTGDVQAPRVSGTGDVQAPRVSGTGDVQAPRVSGTGDVQAPRVSGTGDVQAPRVEEARELIRDSEEACKAGDMTLSRQKAREAMSLLR
jgi:hypothetical protein